VPLEKSVELLANKPNLEELYLDCEKLRGSEVPHLQRLFDSCRHLRKLDLGMALVSAPALDVILSHGTGITSLAAGSLRPASDNATAPCAWQELFLRDTRAPLLAHLGYLPLHSVKHLKIGGNSINTLQLPYSNVMVQAIPNVLYEAALNIANCPAWKESSATRIRVVAEPSFISTRPPGAQFSSGLSSQLIRALAPLAASPGITELEIDPDTDDPTQEAQLLVNFKWGARQVCHMHSAMRIRTTAVPQCNASHLWDPSPWMIHLFLLVSCPLQVRALAATFGTRLTTPRIGGSHLEPDFWAALEEHLPSLRVLHLKESANFTLEGLLAFCVRLTPRPITIRVHMQPEDRAVCERMQQAVLTALAVQQPEAGGVGSAHTAEAAAPPPQVAPGSQQVLSRHVLVPYVEPPATVPVLTNDQRWGRLWRHWMGESDSEPDME
jgi:hypothetical protein